MHRIKDRKAALAVVISDIRASMPEEPCSIEAVQAIADRSLASIRPDLQMKVSFAEDGRRLVFDVWQKGTGV